ncbi:MAG TPA: hypothetical protein VN428_11255, partial [Bryobacteraceae bacterium]|nr:hypothetical protein [Bryobacteraceae bacterium]
MRSGFLGMCAFAVLALGSATMIPITGTVSHSRDLQFKMQGDSFRAEAWVETIGVVGACDPGAPCNASKSIDPLADQA